MKLKENRKWWHIGKWDIHIESNLLWYAQFLSFEIRLNSMDGCRGIQICMCIPKLFDFWFEVSHPIIDKLLPTVRTKSCEKPGEFWDMPVEKNIGISWHADAFWWALWQTNGEWKSSQPWWWEGSFHPKDFLLGRQKYFETKMKFYNQSLYMPEGRYGVHVKAYIGNWKRPRWPWIAKLPRYNLEYSPPIPIPGKGENSWDCGDDAIHSTTITAITVFHALEDEKKSVIKGRRQYGGKNWVPDKGWKVERKARI